MNIGSWSMWHLLSVEISWLFVVLLGILAILAIRLWHAREVGERFSSDLAVAITPSLRMGLLIVVFLPPLLLTGCWLWTRWRT
ncbi:MAG TPA: hypothetical protein VFJ96_04760 [Gemmatimonadaceae bacterium]|nr:hypothetical protein [Gemmatimonadaceae bacterium]